MMRDISLTNFLPCAAELLNVKLVLAKIAVLVRTVSLICARVLSSSFRKATEDSAG
ncbi:Uncharacterised protein [Mycobacteroides abscessus subsp. massiliense]|nr:Uncharacterised protein [Mycobacteroides abscessus subsp. massiliense]